MSARGVRLSDFVRLGENYGLFIALSGCALLGGLALAAHTPWGLGLSPDSAVYISAARSLIVGNGLSLPTDSSDFAPVVHYPPLYPALLALLGLGGLDPIPGARYLNILLFCVNVFLAGITAFMATHSFRFSVITSLLVATAFPIVVIHSMAWSEPLFVFLEFCGILFLVSYFWRSAYWPLTAAAVAVGLSVLGRYAGLALVASGTAGILLLGKRHWKRNAFDAGVFLVVSLVPISLWIIRNRWFAGTATNRQIGFHPVGFDFLGNVVSIVLGWFSGFWDTSTPAQIITVCVILIVSAAFLNQRRRKIIDNELLTARRLRDISFLMALIVVNYLGLLVISISFLDAQIPLDTRILSPVYVALPLLVLSSSTWLVLPGNAGKNFGLGMLVVALTLIGLQLPSTVDWLRRLQRDGMGYSSRGWVESELIKELKLLDSSVPIFSNAPDAVYTLVGRPAAMIPRKVNPDSNLPNPDYGSQVVEMKNNLKSRRGLLVYFNHIRWRWYLPSATELEEVVGLQALIRTNDGSVYRITRGY